MTKYREKFRRAEETRHSLERRIEESCRKSGHARPRTRREFLNQGLIAGVGTVFLPSIATILAMRNAEEGAGSAAIR